MEVKWTKISMKQDFEGNVVVTYENDEMIYARDIEDNIPRENL